MTKLLVDGKEIDVPAEFTLRQACEAAGAQIPHFWSIAERARHLRCDAGPPTGNVGHGV
jgi:UPF0288 family protein (methanogenesis marker protein 3)